MSTARYKLYLHRVREFVKTLVIKSDQSAATINADLSIYGYSVNVDQPSTWKYYLNLSGEYHVSDEMMQITSLDTLQTIDFTKANLVIHRATAREYIYGSSYYRDLVERFPEQEDLILGIISPVSIQDAIAAEDGAILSYDTNHIEDNEYDVIPRLQDWIYGFLSRWYVEAYTLSDDLYAAAVWGVMYAHMPQVIVDIRNSNVRTEKVHSYHIREYLASHGRLDEFIDALTTKQALFLYRNILYIRRNGGKQSTNDMLIEWIMTERNLPTSSYDMIHNLVDQPDELRPTPELIQRPINFQQLGGRSDTALISNMLAKEFPIAKDNINIYEDELPETIRRMQSAPVNETPTKIIESDVIDLSNRTPLIYEDFLVNHWLYWAANNRYTSYVSITNPVSGEVFRVRVLDAFKLYLYCFNKSNGIELTNIPTTLEAVGVRFTHTPDEQDLRAIVDTSLVPQAHFDEALDDLLPVGVYISTEGFTDAVAEIHDRALRHRRQYVRCEDMYLRGHVEALTRRFYGVVDCDIIQGGETTFTGLMDVLGIDLSALSPFDFNTVATEILNKATGANLTNTRSIEWIQQAMLRLMARLSSYSVQYIGNANITPYRVLDWADIRLGDVSGKVEFGGWLYTQIHASNISWKIYTGDQSLSLIPEDFEESVSSKMYANVDVGVPERFVMSAGLTDNITFDAAPAYILNLESFGFMIDQSLDENVLAGLDNPYFDIPLVNALLFNDLDGLDLPYMPALLENQVNGNDFGSLTTDSLPARLDKSVFWNQLRGLPDFFAIGELKEFLPETQLQGLGIPSLKGPIDGTIPPGPMDAHWVNTPSNRTTDISLSSSDMFLSAVDDYAGESLPANTFSIGPIETGNYGREVSVVLTALPSTQYEGDTRVHFNRNDIATLFDNGTFNIVTNDPVDETSIADSINAEVGTNLAHWDLDLVDTGANSLDVVMRSSNLAWTGTLAVTVEPAWDFTPYENGLVKIDGTEYYRFIVTEGASLGPEAIGDPLDYLLLGTWSMYRDGSEVVLNSPTGVPARFALEDAELADHIDFAFDQNGGVLIVYSVNDTIKLYWYNPQTAQTEVTDIATGMTPYITPSSWNDVAGGDREVLIVYCRDGDVRYRRQDDRYSVEYSMGETDIGAILHVGFDVYESLVVEFFDVGTQQIHNIATEPAGLWNYDEIPDVQPESIINNITIRDATVEFDPSETIPDVTPSQSFDTLSVDQVTFHDVSAQDEIPDITIESDIVMFNVTDGSVEANSEPGTIPEAQFAMTNMGIQTYPGAVYGNAEADTIMPAEFTTTTLTITTYQE